MTGSNQTAMKFWPEKDLDASRLRVERLAKTGWNESHALRFADQRAVGDN